MSVRQTDNTLAMLDLLSCAFGGVIVLAVVLAALIGSRDAVERQSYLVVDGWIRPVPETGSTPVESLPEEFQLGFVVTEPDGCSAYFLASNQQGAGECKSDFSFSAGKLGPEGAESGAFAALLADQVEAGIYEVRLCIAYGPDLPPSEQPVEMSLRVRYPSRSRDGREIQQVSITSVELQRHWAEHAFRCDSDPLLETRVQVEL